MSSEKKPGGRGTRFAGGMDPAAAALNASVHFDRRLLRDDVRGSQAHAHMLAGAGLISREDEAAIVSGLDRVAGELESGERRFDPALEDVHMNVESRLIELVGEAGRRLHTARSRNDQVATDLKLYARHAALELRNSLDTVSDRDFAAEICFACALLGVHLSRLGEELVLWSTTEFGFVRLGEGYCSGSSLMPQKRNPDVAELLRGKPGRVIGDLVALLTISKGLALAYNKDLQETQEPLYDAIETARLSLAVVPGLVAALEFDVERMRVAAGDPALGATDLAEELVRGGMPFRSAHDVVGRVVRRAEEKGVTLRDLDADDLRAIDPALSPRTLDALDPVRAVAARTLPGGPAPAAVERELGRLEQELRALGLDP